MPKFKPPQGFAPSDETEESETFKYLGEAYIDSNGDVCLVSMDGAKFEEASDKPKETPKEEMSEKKDERTFDQKFDELSAKTGGKFY